MSRQMRNATSILVTIALLLTSFFSIPSVVTAAPSFRDVDTHWAGGYIKSWANQGLIGGYGDGTFRPNNPITKAEFIVLVNRVMGYTETAEIDFPDVPAGTWYRGDVAKSRAVGYSVVYDDGTFGPNKPLSREEAAFPV